jgi:hypothetical protein
MARYESEGVVNADIRVAHLSLRTRKLTESLRETTRGTKYVISSGPSTETMWKHERYRKPLGKPDVRSTQGVPGEPYAVRWDAYELPYDV